MIYYFEQMALKNEIYRRVYLHFRLPTWLVSQAKKYAADKEMTLTSLIEGLLAKELGAPLDFKKRKVRINK